MPENGYVKARISTSRGELPVIGAVVTVTLNDSDIPMLLGKRTTDRNGQTTPITVSAPNSNESESPGAQKPYASVDVRVDHPGYYTIFIGDAQVFGGQTTVVDASLVPLSDNEAYDNRADIYNETPQNL